MNKIMKNQIALLGGIIVLLYIIISIFGPYFTRYTPDQMNPDDMLMPPCKKHLFGTDQFGRDIFTRIVYGTRVSFSVGIFSVAIAGTLGVIAGLLGGFFGGWIDAILMHIMDIIFTFPAMLLAIFIMAILGETILNIVMAIGIVYTPQFARVTRASVLSIKNMDYIQAARALGVSSSRIITKHVLKNAIAPIIVQISLTLSLTVLLESALSFLGLGVQPPAPSWGNMLSTSREFMIIAPWTAIFPGLAIMLLVLGFNLLGDGLRDILDPRLKNVL